MGLESATYISDLDPSNPLGGDGKNQGDDHIRLIKQVLQNTFPNANAAQNIVGAGSTQISTNTILTAANQGQLILVDTSSGVVTITLPLGSTLDDGWRVTVMKVSDDVNVCAVDGQGAEKVENTTSPYNIKQHYDVAVFQWVGAINQWVVPGKGFGQSAANIFSRPDIGIPASPHTKEAGVNIIGPNGPLGVAISSSERGVFVAEDNNAIYTYILCGNNNVGHLFLGSVNDPQRYVIKYFDFTGDGPTLEISSKSGDRKIEINDDGINLHASGLETTAHGWRMVLSGSHDLSSPYLQLNSRTALPVTPTAGQIYFTDNAIYKGSTKLAGAGPDFTSGEIAWAPGSISTAAHGLGAVPSQVEFVMRCKIPEGNWVAGDELHIDGWMSAGAQNRGCMVYADATNLGVIVSSSILWPFKTSAGSFLNPPTAGNWKVVFRAWR